MANFDLRPYALIGAKARLEELNREAAAILASFPELGGAEVKTPTARKAKSRGGWKMSAAQKKAVSARMKRYWKARRAKG